MTPARPIIARFAKRNYWDRPSSNFEACDLIYGDVPERGQSPLATVNRIRKTKRSVWQYEIRAIASTSPLSLDDFAAYYARLHGVATTIVWPSDVATVSAPAAHHGGSE